MPAELLDQVLARAIQPGFQDDGYFLFHAGPEWHQFAPDHVPATRWLLGGGARRRGSIPRSAAVRSTILTRVRGRYSAGNPYLWSGSARCPGGLVQAKGGCSARTGYHFAKRCFHAAGAMSVELFRNFTGADPYVVPLLKRRGLTNSSREAPAPDTPPKNQTTMSSVPRR